MALIKCKECGKDNLSSDKKCNNCGRPIEKFGINKLKDKKVLISIGIVVGVITILIVSTLITDSIDDENDTEELITYTERYYNVEDKDYYVNFFNKSLNSGTCIINAATESCVYEIIDDKNIILSIEQNENGVTVNSEMHFEIIDKETIKRISFRIWTKDINPPAIEDDTIFTTDLDKVKKTETSKKEEWHKTYNLAGSKDNPRATIEFQSGNNCKIDFSASDVTLDIGRRDYLRVIYKDGLCSYEKINDYDFVIRYTGTFNIIHPVPQLSSSNTYVFQTANQEMNITFGDDYNSFKITNGEWDIVNHAIYFKTKGTTDLEENNSEDNSSSENDSNDNSTNNDNYNNSSAANDNSSDTSNNDSLNYEYEYRYRDKKEVIEWTNWSEWTTEEITATDNREVETRQAEKQTYKTIYKYKHYICPNPSQLNPNGNSTPYEADCSGGYWEYTESEYKFKFKNNTATSVGCNIGYGGYYDYKKYSTISSKEQCWFENGTRQEANPITYITEYRYRSKYTSYEWTEWSDWSSIEYKESTNRQVESRRVSN